MNFKSLKPAPLLITASVMALVFLAHSLPRWAPRFDVFERLEWITYDWRMRQAAEHPQPVATNLGAVFLDDDSLKTINQATEFNYPWPRSLYGQLVGELSAQGARSIGFDIFFIDRFPDYTETRLKLASGRELSADEYFARQIRRAGNVILGAPGQTSSNVWSLLPPAEIFRTNAMTVGHAASEKDSDGVLRRAKPFKDDKNLGRIWHLGIIMAAQHLQLDLKKAIIEPGRIILRGTNGVERIIPVDAEGLFYINWSLAWNDRRILKDSFESLWVQSIERGQGTNITPVWKDRLVVVGSIGSGNNISDVGATPIQKETYLVSKHWNVANSVITGDFVRRAPPAVELALIAVLGIISALLSWRLRPPWPSLWVLLVAGAYTAAALWLFITTRYWVPIILPVAGALLLNHVSTVTYQVVFEQREKRRVKGVFARLVSPNVVNELLNTEKLNLGGGRREITVFFADVRGFTQLTDQNQMDAERYVREHNLTGPAAEACFDESARETLTTVNTYLATIADQIKLHEGTLDKYIGDCVMAFWGAPTPNPHHAVSCVRAAIDAQRAMQQLNLKRAEENKRRENENAGRALYGKPPLPLLPLLALGTGINTGVAMVGLMGSDQHILNYTVFGREINLASRLEGVSGRGRIIVGESTCQHVKRDDPQLAATFVELDPVMVKGISQPVKIFEVPWKSKAPQEPATNPAPTAPPPSKGH